MTRKVAFVGFGAVSSTDSQRVAGILGLEYPSHLQFFNSINEAAKFVVSKNDSGVFEALKGSELFVSSQADADTISKARKIRSVGVAVNLDWEPFVELPESDNVIAEWITDGEWSVPVGTPALAISEPVVVAPVMEETQPAVSQPTFVEPETPAPSFEAPSEPTPNTTPSYEAIISGGATADFVAPVNEEVVDFVVPEDTVPYREPVSDDSPAPLPVSPIFTNNNIEIPNNQQAPTVAPAPETYSAPAPEYIDYSNDPITDVLDDAQDQSPAAAPLQGFLQINPEGESTPPSFEQTLGQYQEPATDYQQPYPAEEPVSQQPQYAEPQYDATQYDVPVPQPEASQPVYDTPPPYEAPAPYAAPVQEYAAPESFVPQASYTPPTPAAPFIQQAPTAPPEPSRYEQERKAFGEVPAGNSMDFESKGGGKIVYVTGSHGGVGKTTTAWTLASLVAVAMRKAGREDVSVWLIESDYRNSKLAQRHNIDPNRTSGHLAGMLEWLSDQQGNIPDLPQKKAHAIANSTHRLENGLNIIACPYDTTKRETSYIQQAVYQAAQYAKMQGGIVFIDADTISNDDIMDSKLAKSADRVVIVSDAGEEHLDDLKRAAKILTSSVVNGGLGVSMTAITVLLNKTGADEFRRVDESNILAPLALGGYLPFIPEWATGWVGSQTATDTFKNAVVLFARFFKGVIPLKELNQWDNYQVNKPKKNWLRRITQSKPKKR